MRQEKKPIEYLDVSHDELDVPGARARILHRAVGAMPTFQKGLSNRVRGGKYIAISDPAPFARSIPFAKKIPVGMCGGVIPQHRHDAGRQIGQRFGAS